jgi:transmembrane sensor
MIDDERLLGFGRALVAAQDGTRRDDPTETRARVRERLLVRADRDARAPSIPWVVATAVAVAAALVLWIAWPRALTFAIGPEDAPGVAGAWLAAPGTEPQALRFSDGSVVDLHAGSRARVVQLHRDGAQVVLEAGAAEVAIVPGAASRWRIDAGPYLVDVTGTRFDVAWDPHAEVFALTLHEGAVIVRGPGIDGERAVGAGESLRIGEPPPSIVAVASPTAADAIVPPSVTPISAPVVDAAPSIAPSPAPAGKPRAPARPRASAPVDEPADWRALAEAASYREALAAAEAQGFEPLCEALPAKDLLRLADVARFARRPERAAAALDAARRRFPDTDAAAMAAFERGRMAFARGAHRDAIPWFATYLRERPDGSIAREATGRLMESQHEAGQAAAAQATAGRYVARWPEGPDADLARSLAAVDPD